MIALEKWQILTPLQKLLKNVEDWGKKLMPKSLKSCPKSNKSPNLVTLSSSDEDEDRLLFVNKSFYFYF